MKRLMWSYLLVVLVLCFAQSADAQTRFAVVSDMHVMDESLHDNGSAFKNMLASNARVVEHSAELLDSVVLRLVNEHPDFVLVPGDLTHEGELASHERVRSALKKLTDAGIAVYVVPGNHDMDNPMAYKYTLALTTKTENLKAADFASFYGDFGYNKAVLKDASGLSYMVYPADGLAIICLNSAKMEGKSAVRNSGGGITSTQMKWIHDAANKAKKDGRKVMAMMHHPVVRHHNGHEIFAERYLANCDDGYPELSELQNAFIDADVHIVFTGHYHIHSIQHTSTDYGELVDITTSSLSAYASQYRMCSVGKDGVLRTYSRNIPKYFDLEAERNVNTTKNAISIVCNKFYPKLDSIYDVLPDAVQDYINFPTSKNKMASEMQQFVLPSFSAMFNALALGDEDKGPSEDMLNDCMDGYDDYISYLCDNNTVATYALRAATVLVKYEVRDVCKSVLYNYVDDVDNVVADASGSFTLKGISTGEYVSSLETTTSSQSDSGIKVFENGQIVIKYGDKTYNVLGMEMQ